MSKICLVLILLSSRASALQLNFPQDTVAYNDRFNNRQSAAFDSQGRIHVSYTGQMGTNSATREIYYVTQSGDSFVTQQVTSNAVDDNYSTICIGRNNDVHIGFEGRDAGNLFQLQYTRLVNGVFTTPVYITQGGVTKATPYCALGRDSVMHFVYFTFTTPPNSAYYRKYDLRDSSLSAEQLLTQAEVTGDFDAAIASDTTGFVHIVVKSGTATGGPMKYYTNRSGTLVETPTGVSATIDYPRVLVDKRNVVHILYRDSAPEILKVINNATGSFGPPAPLTPAGQRPAGYHNFAVDDQHRLYIVYQSSVATSGRGWYLVHGKDGTFSDTIQVFDLPPGYVTRNTSTVIARGDGEIAVTYSPGASRGGFVVCDIFAKRGVLPTSGIESQPVLPPAYTLEQNYPNPFNPSTVISFSVPRSSFISLRVFDQLGREVATLVEGAKDIGEYRVTLDASRLSSGVYFYRLQADGFRETKKLLLLR